MYVCGNFSEQIHYLMQVNQLSPNLQLFWSNSFMVDLFDKYDIYYWTSYQLYSFYNLPKNTAIVIACRINKKNPLPAKIRQEPHAPN